MKNTWLKKIFSGSVIFYLIVVFLFSSIPVNSAISVTVSTLYQVNSSADDSHYYLNEQFSANSPYVVLKASVVDVRAGIKFDSVSISGTNAEVTEAYLSVYVENVEEDGDSHFVTIYGMDEDNQGDFSSHADYGDPTSAYGHWDISDLDEEGWHNSSNLATVVNEIIDRAGWSSGNSIAFQIYSEQSGTGSRIVRSYDGNSSLGARLYVTYEYYAASDELWTLYETYGDFDIYTYSQTQLTGVAENIIQSSGTITLTWFADMYDRLYSTNTIVYDEDSGRWLAFFYEDDNGGWRYISTDDFSTWSSEYELQYDTSGTDIIDVEAHIDGSSDIDLVYVFTDDIRWRRMNLNASNYLELQGSGKDYDRGVNQNWISCDVGNDGFSYIYTYGGNPDYAIWYANDQTDGSWNEYWNYARAQSSTYGLAIGWPSGDSIVGWHRYSMDGYVYDYDDVSGWGSAVGMHGAEQDLLHFNMLRFSDNDILMVGQDHSSYNDFHVNVYDYATLSAGTYSTVTLTNQNNYNTGQVAIDLSNDYVYLVWYDTTDNCFYLQYSADKTASWSSATNVLNCSDIWRSNNVDHWSMVPYVEEDKLGITFATSSGTYYLKAFAPEIVNVDGLFYVFDLGCDPYVCDPVRTFDDIEDARDFIDGLSGRSNFVIHLDEWILFALGVTGWGLIPIGLYIFLGMMRDDLARAVMLLIIIEIFAWGLINAWLG